MTSPRRSHSQCDTLIADRETTRDTVRRLLLSPSAGDRSAAADRLLVLILTVGLLARVAAYLFRGPFFVDEAMLALSIAVRDLREFTQPLLYNQSAPTLFMMLSKGMAELGGLNRWTLRFIPLVSSCISLALFAALCRRLISVRVAIVGSSILSLLPVALYYGADFKPYAVDLLIGTAVLVAGGRLLMEVFTWKPVFALVVVGIVGPWLSATAVLVLTSVCGVVLLEASVNRHVRKAVWVVGCLVLTGLSFAFAFRLNYGYAAADTYMRYFWADSYLDFTSRSAVVSSLGLVRRTVSDLFLGYDSAKWMWTLFPRLTPGIRAILPFGVILLFVGGILSLARRNGWQALLVMAPLVALAGASFLKLYPLAPRLILCAVPSLILGLSIAPARLIGRIPWPVWPKREAALRVPRTVLLCSLAVEVALVMPFVRAQSEADHARALTQWLLRGDEVVYVSARALPEFLLYATDWRSRDTAQAHRLLRLSEFGGPFFSNAPRAQQPVERALLAPIPLGADSVLLGLPDGIIFRNRNGFNRSLPDSTWLDAEVDRISATGRDAVAIAAFHNGDGAAILLRLQLLKRGWLCDTRRVKDRDFVMKCRR